MQSNLLILGGTTEATALAQIIAKTPIKATISYAGRVNQIRQQPVAMRLGALAV